jgi:acetate kinase
VVQLLGVEGVDDSRVITCHLGNGCSVAVVRNGRSVDTSMGFTPLEGLVMGTRSGDMDPAIVHYLMSPEGGGFTDDQIHDLLNRESGLKGLSGLSSDVRDLLDARSKGHDGAALALSVFTYRLKKYICAYHGVLSGADALVFTAGIGENSPEIRSETLVGLEPLGFVLDEGRNVAAKGVEAEITGEGSAVRIFVIPTDEDRMIFQETKKIINAEGAGY